MDTIVHFIELAGAVSIVVTTYFHGQDTPDVPKKPKIAISWAIAGLTVGAK